MSTYYKNFVRKFRSISFSFWNPFITIFLVVATHPSYNVVNAEYFSSVDSLQKLTYLEMNLIRTFREYLAAQKSELESYQSFIESIKTQHSMASEGLEDYTGNPINAFSLIKRMVLDWTSLKEFIEESQAKSAFQQTLEKLNEEMKIPDENELKGAVNGLIRLQRVYNLSTFDLAHGQFQNVVTGTELSWSECFEVATNLFDEKEFSHALPWFELVLEKLYDIENNEEDATLLRFKVETLDYLALSYYELGQPETAAEFIDEILELEPSHYTRNIQTYITSGNAKQPPASKLRNYNETYAHLCQGKQSPQKELRNLKCTVETRGSPHFIIAPLKVEQLNKDPEIKVYHGLLTDSQIDQVISEAEDNMIRSRVGQGPAGTVSDIRVSQQAWLRYESPVMKTIYNLVGDITGLDLRNAETMQMANYGIGGQYDQHHDFFGPGYYDIRFPGDRITTNVLYLSDVEEGGHTVFPYINVFARPKKGSMVSWNNLHKSLDADYRTLHAGCPVVVGSKRIGNVWVHSEFQEFRRPCGLENDTYKSHGYS